MRRYVQSHERMRQKSRQLGRLCMADFITEYYQVFCKFEPTFCPQRWLEERTHCRGWCSSDRISERHYSLNLQRTPEMSRHHGPQAV